MTELKNYGFTQDMTPENNGEITARITAVHKERYEIVCDKGELYARLKKSAYFSGTAEDFPTVGDFVLVKFNQSGDSQIVKTLPRKTKFSRNDFSGHAVGYVKTVKEQVVAANFDYVFIMQSLNHDLSIRRLERYLALAWQSGGIPVVVLTKADLATDNKIQQEIIEELEGKCKIHVISTKTGFGLNTLSDYLQQGKTIVFLGSSGVGKSSLVNALVGNELMAVREIRQDDSRGRHATTHRQMIELPCGAVVIDTPGMRELGMWDLSRGIGEVFLDIESLGACKFSDCNHESEPGCAVKAAIKRGELSQERWESYLKIKWEAEFAKRKSPPKKQNTKNNPNKERGQS